MCCLIDKIDSTEESNRCSHSPEYPCLPATETHSKVLSTEIIPYLPPWPRYFRPCTEDSARKEEDSGCVFSALSGYSSLLGGVKLQIEFRDFSGKVLFSFCGSVSCIFYLKGL